VEDRELQIEAAQLGVLEALPPLLAAAHILPCPDRGEIGATLEQLGDELQCWGSSQSLERRLQPSSLRGPPCHRVPGLRLGPYA
jgi:hypothetical protein